MINNKFLFIIIKFLLLSSIFGQKKKQSSIIRKGTIAKYEIKQLNNLLNFDLNMLIIQSKEEGFRFVERLVNDYKNGTNTFIMEEGTPQQIFENTKNKRTLQFLNKICS